MTAAIARQAPRFGTCADAALPNRGSSASGSSSPQAAGEVEAEIAELNKQMIGPLARRTALTGATIRLLAGLAHALNEDGRL